MQSSSWGERITPHRTSPAEWNTGRSSLDGRGQSTAQKKEAVPSFPQRARRSLDSDVPRSSATSNRKDPNRKDPNRKDPTSAIVETVEGGGVEKSMILPRQFDGAPGEFQFSLEFRKGDQYKHSVLQVEAQNFWTKREYRVVLSEGDASRIVQKPLQYVYHLLTKALSGESRTANVVLGFMDNDSKESKALQVCVCMRSEFDDTKHVFKLYDATTATDAARLQELVLDLRQESWKVQQRARAVEDENGALKEQNALLEARVLQLERNMSILLGDHEQHVLPLMNSFKTADEEVYGPVFAKRLGRRCVFNGFVMGSSPRGDHEGSLVCALPNTLWPRYKLIFNSFYCSTEGHFCNYTVNVRPNGQVRAVTYGKQLGINLSLIDYLLD